MQQTAYDKFWLKSYPIVSQNSWIGLQIEIWLYLQAKRIQTVKA